MTELRLEKYEIPAAELGPENPLPAFRTKTQDLPVTIDPSVPPEDGRHLGWRTGYRVLPHRLQDGYNRDLRPRAFKAYVLENEFLRATFLPEVGGRLVSLVHKPKERELLDRNPVFQPANLALRNAWFSGGIEWNTCHFGHYYLTCSPVFAARVQGSQGEPVLRLYEWDRVKGFPWQIDFHLPPGSPFLITRVRLLNPQEHQLPMYWWTNMAVPELPGTRVLCPADSALQSSNGKQIAMMHMPIFEGRDISYGADLPNSRELFFRIPDGQRRWEAALNRDGTGLVHASTSRLLGRKVFYWGSHAGGRRWQEFLSVPGRAYLEIQAGLARTQLESVPMPAGAEWTWTEAFGLLEADPKKVHAADWESSWRAADAALEMALPQTKLDQAYTDLARVTSRPAQEILASGSGWGALERKRLKKSGAGDRIPAELDFGSISEEQKPWLELLENGALPERSPEAGTGALMVQPEWQKLLEAAVNAGRGDHWLSWWHLGNMRLENFDEAGAHEAWEKSVQRRRTGWALRNLSVLASRDAVRENPPAIKFHSPENPTPTACELLKAAWEAGPQVPSLALEYAQMLLQTKQYQELHRLTSALPEELRRNERIHILAAFAALQAGELDKVTPLFERDFATIREGEVTLTDIWFAYHEQRIAAAEKIPIDDTLRRRVKKEFPPPQKIDFRIISEPT
ncbi:MAG TPA: DUF5107 domain-containing protein [Planctomycetota bacterium]|nr:DUF5107 domain-containing protein [Planctomycetota bacterium]